VLPLQGGEVDKCQGDWSVQSRHHKEGRWARARANQVSEKGTGNRGKSGSRRWARSIHVVVVVDHVLQERGCLRKCRGQMAVEREHHKFVEPNLRPKGSCFRRQRQDAE
jgi:hypothetical protein